MGQDLLEQRLTALCFWLFEPRKFNTVIKDIAEEMLRVGMKNCPVSVQRLHRHLATLFISLLATVGEEGKCNNVKI